MMPHFTDAAASLVQHAYKGYTAISPIWDTISLQDTLNTQRERGEAVVDMDKWRLGEAFK